MIKSLRKKFILINMLLVSLVLLIVFSILCIASYRRMEFENIRALERALSRRDDQKPPTFEIGQLLPPDFMRDPVFVVQIDQGGRVGLIMSNNISVSAETLEKVAAKAELSGQESGVLGEYHLFYLKKKSRTVLE